MDGISGDARRELVRAVGERYRTGERDEKHRILDEFVAVTRWHRKHAIRVLNVAGAEGEPRRTWALARTDPGVLARNGPPLAAVDVIASSSG